MIIEYTDSASALALQKLGASKKKITIFAGSATTELTGKQCSPYVERSNCATGSPSITAACRQLRWHFCGSPALCVTAGLRA
jgi:hypothetical protein